jgi:zinc transporter ZupT
MRRSWLGLANALAAGFMAGASVGLLYEGGIESVARTALGAIIGGAFVFASHRILGGHDDLHVGALRGAGARRGLIIIAIMTVHSITEGVGVGVSFADGKSIGLLIAVAIAVHNVPEGLAISLALVPSGSSVPAAAAWSIFSSLPQPLMAVPAYLGVHVVRSLLPWGLGFAAGAMLWLSLGYMLPDSFKDVRPIPAGMTFAIGTIVMVAVGAVIAF